MSDITVLVVDDEERMRKLIEGFFRIFAMLCKIWYTNNRYLKDI